MTSDPSQPELTKQCPRCRQAQETWSQICPSCDYEWPSRREQDASPWSVGTALEAAVPITPWVTPALLGANLAVFGLMVATGVSPLAPTVKDLTTWGANAGALTTGGQWWRLFTCMFLHIGFIHLAFNMAVLWTIGRFMERLLGNSGFAVLYLLAGLCGSLASIAWNPDVVSAGASGAIFGLYGALLGFLLRDRHCVPAPARSKLVKNALFFIGFNVLFGVANRHIDLAAHLGGLAGGLLCGYALALSPAETQARRLRTHARVLAGGLLATGLLALAVPRGRDFQSGLQRIGAVDTAALQAFDKASAQVQAGTMNDAQFADVIETQVVPGLREVRTQLAGLRPSGPELRTFLSAADRYTRAREDGYTQIVHALRTRDLAQAERVKAQLAAAAARFQDEVKGR